MLLDGNAATPLSPDPSVSDEGFDLNPPNPPDDTPANDVAPSDTAPSPPSSNRTPANDNATPAELGYGDAIDLPEGSLGTGSAGGVFTVSNIIESSDNKPATVVLTRLRDDNTVQELRVSKDQLTTKLPANDDKKPAFKNTSPIQKKELGKPIPGGNGVIAYAYDAGTDQVQITQPGSDERIWVDAKQIRAIRKGLPNKISSSSRTSRTTAPAPTKPAEEAITDAVNKLIFGKGVVNAAKNLGRSKTSSTTRTESLGEPLKDRARRQNLARKNAKHALDLSASTRETPQAANDNATAPPQTELESLRDESAFESQEPITPVADRVVRSRRGERLARQAAAAAGVITPLAARTARSRGEKAASTPSDASQSPTEARAAEPNTPPVISEQTRQVFSRPTRTITPVELPASAPDTAPPSEDTSDEDEDDVARDRARAKARAILNPIAQQLAREAVQEEQTLETARPQQTSTKQRPSKQPTEQRSTASETQAVETSSTTETPVERQRPQQPRKPSIQQRGAIEPSAPLQEVPTPMQEASGVATTALPLVPRAPDAIDADKLRASLARDERSLERLLERAAREELRPSEQRAVETLRNAVEKQRAQLEPATRTPSQTPAGEKPAETPVQVPAQPTSASPTPTAENPSPAAPATGATPTSAQGQPLRLQPTAAPQQAPRTRAYFAPPAEKTRAIRFEETAPTISVPSFDVPTPSASTSPSPAASTTATGTSSIQSMLTLMRSNAQAQGFSFRAPRLQATNVQGASTTGLPLAVAAAGAAGIGAIAAGSFAVQRLLQALKASQVLTAQAIIRDGLHQAERANTSSSSVSASVTPTLTAEEPLEASDTDIEGTVHAQLTAELPPNIKLSPDSATTIPIAPSTPLTSASTTPSAVQPPSTVIAPAAQTVAGMHANDVAALQAAAAYFATLPPQSQPSVEGVMNALAQAGMAQKAMELERALQEELRPTTPPPAASAAPATRIFIPTPSGQPVASPSAENPSPAANNSYEAPQPSAPANNTQTIPTARPLSPLPQTLTGGMLAQQAREQRSQQQPGGILGITAPPQSSPLDIADVVRRQKASAPDQDDDTLPTTLQSASDARQNASDMEATQEQFLSPASAQDEQAPEEPTDTALDEAQQQQAALALQMQLQAARQQQAQQAEQESTSGAEVVIDKIKQEVKKKIKREIKKRILQFLIATSEIWAPILLIVLTLGILVIVIYSIASPTATSVPTTGATAGAAQSAPARAP